MEKGWLGALEMNLGDLRKEYKDYSRLAKDYGNAAYAAVAAGMKELIERSERAIEVLGAEQGNRSWGVKRGTVLTHDDLDALFKRYNKDAVNAELWDKALALSRRLGVEVRETSML